MFEDEQIKVALIEKRVRESDPAENRRLCLTWPQAKELIASSD
jgi:hypothetical protein